MSAEPAKVSASDRPAPITGLRVLLIEDTWIIAQSYRALLETLGVEVRGPAATIAAAHQHLDTEKVDAAIVDINLRGEMADPLVTALHARAIPVIIVTGYDVAPELARLAHLVLNKPIRAEDLLTGLRALAAVRE